MNVLFRVVEFADEVEQGVLRRIVDVVPVLAVGAVVGCRHDPLSPWCRRVAENAVVRMACGAGSPVWSQPFVDRGDVDSALEADSQFVEPCGSTPSKGSPP